MGEGIAKSQKFLNNQTQILNGSNRRTKYWNGLGSQTFAGIVSNATALKFKGSDNTVVIITTFCNTDERFSRHYTLNNWRMRSNAYMHVPLLLKHDYVPAESGAVLLVLEKDDRLFFSAETRGSESECYAIVKFEYPGM